MKNIRVIARMDIKGPNLVKGIHLEGLRVLGKPENFSQYYCRNGADELFYMDIVASLFGRNSLLHIVEKTAQETSIPLTVGGGLRTIEDIQKVLRAGADKVALNTAVVRNPDFIRQASESFGSSTIMVTIEAIQQLNGGYYAFTDNGREPTGKEVIAWAQEVEALGAGEIMLTSVDREGTGRGYDVALTKKVSQAVSIPVIACGGAGKLEHIREVINDGQADAVSLASMIHYDFIKNHRFESDYSDEGNVEFLQRGDYLMPITHASLLEVKTYLRKEGVPCRQDIREGAAQHA